MLRAHFGSSRVREDLPRHVREMGRFWPSFRKSFARPRRHQPCTQVTQPLMRSTEARPRFSSSRDRQRTTSPYSSNRNQSIGFSSRAHDISHSRAPRPRWRILRIRLAATRPLRPPLAGESYGFAWRQLGRFGLLWLANPTDSLGGNSAASASSGWRILRIRLAATRPLRPRLERGELPPRDRAAQPISLHSRPLGARWRLR